MKKVLFVISCLLMSLPMLVQAQDYPDDYGVSPQERAYTPPPSGYIPPPPTSTYPVDVSSVGSIYYWGPHPVNPTHGSGFCYHKGSHTHSYAPDSSIEYLYRHYNSHYHFVGDPYHFGYNQTAYAYHGHHPIPLAYGGGYCYIDGPHYHYFPPSYSYSSYYSVRNGRYYYSGAFNDDYYTLRPRYYRKYFTYYNSPHYSRYYRRYNSYWRRYGRRANARYYRRYKRRTYPRVTTSYRPRHYRHYGSKTYSRRHNHHGYKHYSNRRPAYKSYHNRVNHRGRYGRYNTGYRRPTYGRPSVKTHYRSNRSSYRRPSAKTHYRSNRSSYRSTRTQVRPSRYNRGSSRGGAKVRYSKSRR